MAFTIPFSQLNKNDISLAGGKGANLGEMTTADLPIPPGFVLTTAAYDAFVQENGLQPQIVELASNASVADPQSSQKVSKAINKLFLQANMPESVRGDLLAAYAELVKGGELPVAVRSSATAEDLPTASFAGQQDTFLNVRGEEALLEAVIHCWASLWTARAISYRLRQQIDPSTISLAVVVQQLIPADSAGVLFTANPVDGEREQILITASWGLGEAIVGGQVTPDSVVVEQSTWEILSRETAAKTTMTVQTESGTEERVVPQAQQKQSVLDDATAVQLARFGAQIEAHYNMPMDIEWAIGNGEIAILQARPITSLPPAPLKNVVWEPITPNTIWMRRQIVEHMPQPLSPLFEDLYLNQGLDQSMDKLLQAMGEISKATIDLNAFMPHGFAGTINGYAYTSASFEMDWPNLKAILKIYARIFRFFKMTAFDWEGVALPGYQSLIARWAAIKLAETEDSVLLHGISELAAADSTYWFGSALNLGLSRLLDPFFDQLLKSPLIRFALPEPRPVSASYLRGFDSKALDAQADMEAIASTIRESAALREAGLNTAADQLIEAFAAHPEGQPVIDGIQQYLNEYGHQIYNLDFADPTQNEDPRPMLLSLKALVTNPPDQDVRTRQARMAAEREALVAETEQALNPLSRWLFQTVWRWTKRWAPYREHVMFYMGAAWPTVRKLAHELGQRLVDAGTITDWDDIFYLDSSEITTAIGARANGQPVTEYVQLTRERRALRESRKLLTPPPKVPERGALKVGPINLSMFDPTPSDAVNDGPVLSGYAVSTGRITAPASVIYSIEDFNQMKPDTILVCTTTTPAWTPLFSQAVGLVTDVGGPLAHGSIVAREYGIPAVMGTGVATERIKSGMMLIVDGDAGTVMLADEVDAQEAERIQAQETAEKQAAKQRKIFWTLTAGIAVLLFMWWRKRRR